MNWKLKKFNDLTCEDIYGILKIRTEVFRVELIMVVELIQHCKKLEDYYENY